MFLNLQFRLHRRIPKSESPIIRCIFQAKDLKNTKKSSLGLQHDAIADGIKTVKNILAENFVRPDEAEKVKSKIKVICHILLLTVPFLPHSISFSAFVSLLHNTPASQGISKSYLQTPA